MPPDESSNPLERTPDMSSLTPAERARIYKERAAAAGLGRPPAAQGDGGAPPPPAAAPPPAPAEQPAAAARPAAGGGGAGALTPDQRQRLAAAVQRGASGGGAAGATAAAPPATAASARPSAVEAQSNRLVYVWPHLVTIEFLASVLMLVSMIVISMVIQAPLEGHANADHTPNPSKAPWYFLNLQELLLHMHPALAGVLIPAGALALIAIIPYFDRDTRDVGKWFGTPKALAITWFTTWYTTIWLFVLVFFDENVGVKPTMNNLERLTTLSIFTWPSMVNVVAPMIVMNVPIILLLWLIKKLYKPDSARDWMICLFTGFFVSYIILTIVGTFMRGQGMHLMWPWDPKMIRVE